MNKGLKTMAFILGISGAPIAYGADTNNSIEKTFSKQISQKSNFDIKEILNETTFQKIINELASNMLSIEGGTVISKATSPEVKKLISKINNAGTMFRTLFKNALSQVMHSATTQEEYKKMLGLIIGEFLNFYRISIDGFVYNNKILTGNPKVDEYLKAMRNITLDRSDFKKADTGPNFTFPSNFKEDENAIGAIRSPMNETNPNTEDTTITE